MLLLILYLLLALGVSFLCSLLESVLLTLPRAHIVRLVQDGRSSGRYLQGMKDKIERPLAAILTLNTIAHTVGAAGVGAQSLALFGSAYVAVTSAILTLLILVLSEIIPKTLGVVHARRLAAPAAYVLRVMEFIMYPLVVAFQGLSRLLSGPDDTGRLTREEFAVLAELGHAHGALQQKELAIIRNLLRLRSVRVKEIATPRTVTFMLPEDIPLAEALPRIQANPKSRIPLYRTDADDLTGIVLRDDLLQAASSDGDVEQAVSTWAQPLAAIPETASVDAALSELISRRQHMLQVVDEYGGTEGIVTLEDVLETLLGREIVDETDDVADMQLYASRLFRSRLRRRPRS